VAAGLLSRRARHGLRACRVPYQTRVSGASRSPRDPHRKSALAGGISWSWSFHRP